MTTSSEPTAEEREAQLSRLRKRMARAARREDLAGFAKLKAEHDRLKSAHVEASHAEMKAAMRARRVRERAQEAAEEPQRWRLPSGFSSPLAAERARSGWRERREPSAPAGGLRPWRRPALMETRIWRP